MDVIRRFTVGSANGPKSYNWMIRVIGSDVYVIDRGSPANTKISLHETGQCHWQQGSENGVPIGKFRSVEWDRVPTPNTGSLGASFALQLEFPTDLLSAAYPARKPEKTHWIKPAPSGEATVLRFYFSKESKVTIDNVFCSVGPKRWLFDCINLQNGEILVIEAMYIDVDDYDMLLPANESRSAFRFSSHDPMETGLPTRIIFGKLSEDKEVLYLCELGGYPVKDTTAIPTNLSVLQPQEIKYSKDILHAVGSRWQPNAHALTTQTRITMPDPSLPKRGMTSKIVIDATRQFPEEGGPESWPPVSRELLEEGAPNLFNEVDENWDDYLKNWPSSDS